MASSNATRWRLACDVCGVGAWIGPRGDSPPGSLADDEAGRYDVWCESCQTPHVLESAPAPGARCPRCSVGLAAFPRFLELWGELQHLDAVLAAWAGDWAPLATLLPERPRFVTNLNPPEPAAGDPPARVALLTALAHGDWLGVIAAPPDTDPRPVAARAIAHERLGDAAQALAAWDAVLSADDDPRARLARGSLLARAGRYVAATEDLARAGDSFAARWNRAALLVHEGVAASDGLPDPGRMARARAEAGAASDYWSDPTIGRLLWSLLIERELARNDAAAREISDATRAALRGAESEFEHSTFWDRTMMLVGWSRVGARDEVARIAAPLAREQSATLLDEPALAGPTLVGVSHAVAGARTSMDMGEPVEARRSIAAVLARPDLRRFRIPCGSCGRGAIGVEEITDLGE